MSRTPRPPAGVPKRLRDAATIPPDLTRWGQAPAADFAAATDLLEEVYTEAARAGVLGAAAIAALFFERGEAAGVQVPALVRTACAELPDVGDRQGPDLVLEAAVAYFGEPEAPARLTDYTHAGTVPAWVYDNLPGPLAHLCRFYEAGPTRDTFLVSALGCLAGGLPNVGFYYQDDWSLCNLYLSVVAPSGAGKGSLPAARRLLARIDDYLLTVSGEEIKKWERAQKAEPSGPLLPDDDVPVECPPWRRATFAGDISDAEFFLGLHANGGYGVIVESEIATLVSVMGKEWGSYRSKLLMGWANEILTCDRKGRKPLRIDPSAISLVTSGTPRAFTTWIQDNEDGLFNRTGFYTFEAVDRWVSGWGRRERAEAKDEAEGRVADTLLWAYKRLTSRQGPSDTYPDRRRLLAAVFTPDQEARHDALWDAQKDSLIKLGLAPLAAYTHRMATTGLRIAALLSVFRLAADQKEVGTAKSYRVAEDDFRVGLQMGALLMAHGVQLARRHFRGVESVVAGAPATAAAGKGARVTGRQTPKRAFLDEIGRVFGDEPFMRADVVPSLVERVGRKRSSGDGYLAALVEEGFLEVVAGGAQGVYRRTDKAPPPAGVIGAPDARLPVPIGYVPHSLLWPPGQDGALGDPAEVILVTSAASTTPVALPHPDLAEAREVLGLDGNADGTSADTPSESAPGEPDPF